MRTPNKEFIMRTPNNKRTMKRSHTFALTSNRLKKKKKILSFGRNSTKMGSLLRHGVNSLKSGFAQQIPIHEWISGRQERSANSLWHQSSPT